MQRRNAAEARRSEPHHHRPRLAGVDRAPGRAPASSGKTLAEIKLRGLTGATILAIEREGESVVVPAGNERLRAGDVLALAGTQRLDRSGPRAAFGGRHRPVLDVAEPDDAEAAAETRMIAACTSCRTGGTARLSSQSLAVARNPLRRPTDFHYRVRHAMSRIVSGAALMCGGFTWLPILLDAATPQVAPFGSWKSPISAEMLVAKSVRFGDLSIDGDTLYWTELRPEEQGRSVIVRRTADGKIDDVLPPPFSARTTVNEYGGGALLAADGVVYFSNYADQRIWRIQAGRSAAAAHARGQAAVRRLCARCAAQATDQRVRRSHARATPSRRIGSSPSTWRRAT